MKKRIIVLLLVMMLGVMSAVVGVSFVGVGKAQVTPQVYASTEFWDGIKGHGQPNDPYLIETIQDLRHIEYWSKGHTGYTPAQDFRTSHFLLVNSLDITDFCANEPPPANKTYPTAFAGIGTSGTPFRGHFDGGGNTIKVGLRYMARGIYGGLFNYISGATIKNLVIDGFVYAHGTGNNVVGGLFGEMTSSEQFPAGCTIENITIKASVEDRGTFNTDTNTAAVVGGLGGRIDLRYDGRAVGLGSNKVYTDISNIRMEGSASSSKSSARVGGIIGRHIATIPSGSPAGARVVTRLNDIHLLPSAAVIATGGAGSRASGIIGGVEDNVWLITSDLEIANIDIATTTTRSGAAIISGYVAPTAFIAVVNCNVNQFLDLPLIFNNNDANYLKNKTATFRFRRIGNQRVTNIEIGEKLDMRPMINSRINVHEEEIFYSINADFDILHTESKSLKKDFNTKFIVQDAGVSVIHGQLVMDGVIVYSQQFTVTVRLPMPEWAKITIIVVVLGVLVACYQLFFLKKYEKIVAWYSERKEASVERKKTKEAKPNAKKK